MTSSAAQRRIAVAAAVISFIRAGPLTAGASDSAMEARLYISAAPEIEQQWSEGRRLELEGRGLERDEPQLAVARYLGAARVYENIALERPNLARAHWRSARAYWTAGDTLPLDSKTQRLSHFERAEGHASRGIEVDPECAECMLWKFASMGRLRTTRGVLTGVRQLPDMAMLLDRGIALDPTYSDGTDNSTLGNLHYSSAIFYRVFPDWFWVGWLIGVKGDKERALAHSRTALSLHPTRLDYQIELGCQLLCLGSARDDSGLLEEGAKVLRGASLREPESQDDLRELAAAQIMLEQPSKACGYSGDTWVEINRDEARSAAASEELER